MSVPPSQRIALIVEDDPDIRELLSITLRMNGFTTVEAATGHEGLAALKQYRPDLITLDLNLPDLDGVEVCRQCRAVSDAYIVMVTARQDEIDRLVGLETGADDFIGKPFSPRELSARVSAMFRRPRTGAAAAVPDAVPAAEECNEMLRHNDLLMDVEGRVVTLDGQELPLTRIEFDLLETLMTGAQRVWTREALLTRVWGDGWGQDHHLVEVHIRNLRKKLGEDMSNPRFIRTVRGVGYRMMPNESPR
ncbi:response regulator transcription factor [Arthrobacter agilis]|uniref:response regulator transcription factor n=1 Tax=Arthrobacter agilis TaxID=37921 RepID=UPI000B354FC3|nr:response regulator transcription factor [Arthrobacter agilis]OUM42264.1 DNA-binding response regulator [Arthrobacter agilis]PPB45605.1 DNA-binding response regulator [Arthrobacter agilis]TPV26414.1 response regulator transcription factor [Arthrobacter agilis]VDR33691.1 DNA-binding response regulator mtrA [Arthrobacter agilis]